MLTCQYYSSTPRVLNEVSKDDNVRFSMSDAMVLNIIRTYYREYKQCTLSNAQIAKLIYASEKTVERSLTQLRKCGLIENDMKENYRKIKLTLRARVLCKWMGD